MYKSNKLHRMKWMFPTLTELTTYTASLIPILGSHLWAKAFIIMWTKEMKSIMFQYTHSSILGLPLWLSW